MLLSNKVAIITGASRGIGKAIALAMASEGASIVVASRSEEERTGGLPGTIHQTVSEIEALGGHALAMKTDLLKEEDIQTMVSATLKAFGTVDILVNNAAAWSPLSVVEMPTKRWDLIMTVNLKGMFLCTKAVLPVMMKQQSGHILNLSSVQANLLLEGNVAYAASKAAIERFTTGLAVEMKDQNIGVNALRPSYTVTEGFKFFRPDADMSSFQTAEMWGRYAALVVAQPPKDFTGCLLAEDDLKQRFGPTE